MWFDQCWLFVRFISKCKTVKKKKKDQQIINQSINIWKILQSFSLSICHCLLAADPGRRQPLWPRGPRAITGFQFSGRRGSPPAEGAALPWPPRTVRPSPTCLRRPARDPAGPGRDRRAWGLGTGSGRGRGWRPGWAAGCTAPPFSLGRPPSHLRPPGGRTAGWETASWWAPITLCGRLFCGDYIPGNGLSYARLCFEYLEIIKLNCLKRF